MHLKRQDLLKRGAKIVSHPATPPATQKEAAPVMERLLTEFIASNEKIAAALERPPPTPHITVEAPEIKVAAPNVTVKQPDAAREWDFDFIYDKHGDIIKAKARRVL